MGVQSQFQVNSSEDPISKKKKKITKMGWQSVSSGRVPAWQA
jgi:hypothetical protein